MNKIKKKHHTTYMMNKCGILLHGHPCRVGYFNN